MKIFFIKLGEFLLILFYTFQLEVTADLSDGQMPNFDSRVEFQNLNDYRYIQCVRPFLVSY